MAVATVIQRIERPSANMTGSLWDSLGQRMTLILRRFADPYRPELHYMRGPGPKWREKHGFPAQQ